MSDVVDRQRLRDAVEAQQHGAPAEAERLWRAILQQAPGRPDGYLGLAVALGAQGRTAEAAAMIAPAAALFPDNAPLQIEHARAVAAQGDTRTAVALWEDVLARFPGRPAVLTGLSQAYRQTGQFDAAETLLADGLAQFPGHPGLMTEYAGLAEQRGATAEAERRWRAACDRLPEAPGPLLGLARVLSGARQFEAAEQVLSETVTRFPDDARVLCGYALAAEQRNDVAETIRRWTAARARLPRHREPVLHLGRTLRLAGRYDEADAVLTGAPDDVAGSRDVLAEFASVARDRGDWNEAALRWERVRQAFPDWPNGPVGLGTALWMAGRPAEAEAVAALAVARFPQRHDVLTLHARLAHACDPHDLEAAIQRWQRVVAAAPTAEAAATSLGACLVQAGRSAEAETVMTEAVQRLPASVELAERHAALAYRRGDWAETLVRWQRIAAHRPGHPVVLAGLGDMLMALHRYDEAGPVLDHLLRVVPGHARGTKLRERLDAIQGDWRWPDWPGMLMALHRHDVVAPLPDRHVVRTSVPVDG